jgi:hypothetical protein
MDFSYPVSKAFRDISLEYIINFCWCLLLAGWCIHVIKLQSMRSKIKVVWDF